MAHSSSLAPAPCCSSQGSPPRSPQQTHLLPPSERELHYSFYTSHTFYLAVSLSPLYLSLSLLLLFLSASLPPPSPPSQSATSVSEQTGLSPLMPDVCIAYQLHLECGHLINLFDWLCAFVSVVDPEAAESLSRSEGKERGSKEDISPSLQYPFFCGRLHLLSCMFCPG